jgi:hypothetical protein
MTKQIVKDCTVKVVKEDGYWLKLGQKYKVHGTSSWDNSIQIHYAGEILGLNKDFFELSSKYEITDSVAVINNKYSNVKQGQVGTIVEVFTKEDYITAHGVKDNMVVTGLHIAYEVEFCDKDGRTLINCAIAEEDLLKLYFN